MKLIFKKWLLEDFNGYYDNGRKGNGKKNF